MSSRNLLLLDTDAFLTHVPKPARVPVMPPVAVPREAFKLNRDHSVAVAEGVFWNEDMAVAPRGCKVQLLGQGGVAVYAEYHGEPFWIGWSPLPRRRPR